MKSDIIPTKESVSPTYKSLLAKDTELRLRIAERKATANTVNARLMAGQDDSRELRAKMILGDAPAAVSTTDRQELTAILREISDLDYARNLLILLSQKVAVSAPEESGFC